MSDQVLVAIIAAMGGVSTASLAAGIPLLVSSRKHAQAAAVDAKEARNQTANDHGTNLRDDLDQLAAAVRRGFDTQGRQLRAHRAELRAHIAASTELQPTNVVPIERGHRLRRKRTA